MASAQKFLFRLLCINFCESPLERRCLFAFHSAIIAATLVFVHYNRELTFTVPLTVGDTSSVTVRVWFACYMVVYLVVFFEGFWKDNDFQLTFNEKIKETCRRHSHKPGRKFYEGVIVALLLLDLVYMVLSYCDHSHYQYLHNSCMLPKLTIRIRLWGYLFLGRCVLEELSSIIDKVQQMPHNAPEEEWLSVQREYLDLWAISQSIGDFYVWSLCCSIFYVFFDMIVYLFWFFTLDFADDRYFFCEWMGERTKVITKVTLFVRLQTTSFDSSSAWSSG